MLSRKRPLTIATTLALTGQGDTVTLNVTYFNRKQSELEAKLKEEESSVPAVVLFMVKEWDAEYPLTLEGIQELEDDRPGVVYGVIEAFHEARRMQKEKN